ncbi:hypothetical protein FVER53590_28426 [Fusarium verticillioides]|nr:hypothetical protein FVER53590_28426 [Fusarium verticillioides]
MSGESVRSNILLNFKFPRLYAPTIHRGWLEPSVSTWLCAISSPAKFGREGKARLISSTGPAEVKPQKATLWP